MAKGITSGAQRLMENFLSSVEGRSALYDEEMNLIWTNYHEFFDIFDLKKINEETPIRIESSFSTDIDGNQEVLSITPVYKSLRTISAYVCVIRSSYEVYKLMNKTAIAAFSNNMMEKNINKLERLVGLNAYIAEAVRFEEIDDFLMEQKRLLVSMRNETKYYMDTCYNHVNSNEINCNPSMMFRSLCEDAEESFRDLGRKITFSGESRDYYITENSTALATAFLHLLRSHLLLSPLKSNLNISTYYEAGGSFCVSVKSKLVSLDKLSRINKTDNADNADNIGDIDNTDNIDNTGERVLITARAYRELAKKVILFDYNGSFECSDDNKNMQTVFKFPVLKKNRGPVLTTSNSWYLDKKKRVLHTYMMDIIEHEIGELEHAKMESSRKKKLAKHE